MLENYYIIRSKKQKAPPSGSAFFKTKLHLLNLQEIEFNWSFATKH